MSSPASTPLPTVDFHAFHRDELPRLLREGHGPLAAEAARRLGSLAFQLPNGDAYTYLPGASEIEVVAGDERAETVIEVEPEIFSNIVNELDAAAGLLYGSRAKCARGNAMHWLDWEPALRAMFSGRPFYDAETIDLRDRHGEPLDAEHAFDLSDDALDMAHFLRTAGYLLVREIFREDEIKAFLDESVMLRGEAQKGDTLSWWGKNANGEETLCRVTRAATQPQLASIPEDPRMLQLVAVADEPLRHQPPKGRGEGVSIIWKNPSMTEGMSDIPWHRDCGMGGHSSLCPALVASVFLTDSTPETGELMFLPGSWNRGCPPIDPSHPRAPRGAHFAARPGDVTLHYGDTMHAAPPPAGSQLDGYRISAVTAYTRKGARPHRGRHYNDVLHRRDDGQVESLSELVTDD